MKNRVLAMIMALGLVFLGTTGVGATSYAKASTISPPAPAEETSQKDQAQDKEAGAKAAVEKNQPQKEDLSEDAVREKAYAQSRKDRIEKVNRLRKKQVCSWQLLHH